MEAKRILRAGASLAEAYRRSPGERQELIDLLSEASFTLDKANAIAVHHRGDPEAQSIASRSQVTIDAIVKSLEAK